MTYSEFSGGVPNVEKRTGYLHSSLFVGCLADLVLDGSPVKKKLASELADNPFFIILTYS